MSYSELSLKITKELNTDTKKNEGIFFTPPEIVSIMIDYVKSAFQGQLPSKILEPSFGSGEILTRLIDSFPNSEISAVEKNKGIYENVLSELKQNENVNYINGDFLEYEGDGFDLIIGNPPYFVLEKGLYGEYDNYFSGRPNIFGMFIIHSLKKLNKGGVLSFIIPNSFFNCSYYKGIREYIYKNYRILDINDCGNAGFIETDQKTNIIYIMSSNENPANTDFCFMFEDKYILNTKENISKMKDIQNTSTTLKEMGFSVFNGNLVWNQEKDCLTNDMNDTQLIYSSDITENKLKELNKEYIDNVWDGYEEKLKVDPSQKSIETKISKKHYINTDKLFRKHVLPRMVKHLEKTLIEEEKLKQLTGSKYLKQQKKIDHMKSKEFEEKEIQYGPLLIINRGYGNADYNLNYAIVDIDGGYYLENHVLGIKYSPLLRDPSRASAGASSSSIPVYSREELLFHYKNIIKSFQDKRTMSFLESCMGNNAVNTNELEKLLPIFS